VPEICTDLDLQSIDFGHRADPPDILLVGLAQPKILDLAFFLKLDYGPPCVFDASFCVLDHPILIVKVNVVDAEILEARFALLADVSRIRTLEDPNLIPCTKFGGVPVRAELGAEEQLRAV